VVCSRITALHLDCFNGDTDAFPMIGEFQITGSRGFGGAHDGDNGTVVAILGEK
jgi:hypothetical protein